ncbi:MULTISPECIES: DUF2924 domain-containing protein [Hyphobacterium]|uniref:DUF2924 domain-containing protein n=1 Tax=Hyphobacterium vulgare TaxID=1736751 RepID=A0ABV6ZW38_9PROT
MAISASLDLKARLAELESGSREALLPVWREVMKRPVPRRISREMLVRVLAWHIQAQAIGGYDTSTRRRLKQAAMGRVTAPASASLKPGARLVREWNGISHTVDIVDGGAVWQGQRYRSLSAVARAITGARWSGPRFFGLVHRKGDDKAEVAP